jgi:hypothetical protein
MSGAALIMYMSVPYATTKIVDSMSLALNSISLNPCKSKLYEKYFVGSCGNKYWYAGYTSFENNAVSFGLLVLTNSRPIMYSLSSRVITYKFLLIIDSLLSLMNIFLIDTGEP